MPNQSTSQGGILEGGEDFRFILWRRLPRPHAWRGYVSELLASDGRRVRRMYVGDRVLTLQQYDDPEAAAAIARMVEARASGGAGLRGYSIFSGADALAIWHTGSQNVGGWVAFPFTDLPGRAAVLAQLPAFGDNIPGLRLCGGARLRWVSGRLHLDAAIEQRSEGFHDRKGSPDLMDFLVDWRLEVTVEQDGQVKSARLPTKAASTDGIQRVEPRRVESSWMLNEAVHQNLRGHPGLKAWFVLKFDTRLFCLPDPWDTWWFEVTFPDQVDL